MKKLLTTTILFLIAGLLHAQAPQAFKYQAIVRDAGGNAIMSAALTIRASVHDGSATGAIVYRETHAATTNAYGLVNLEIGNGTVVSGSFSAIAWGSGSKWLEMEVDDGSGFVPFGTSQLLSVPYALHAANGGVTGATGATGATGTNGTDGATGATGTPGTNGIDGATGATGAAGTNGTNGVDGATGATGDTGPTGAAGTNGTNGVDGATGATGAAGTNGTDGATGATGATGVAGANGTDGATGATGATGPAGTNGVNGATGATGATGAAGTNGTNGTNGATGATGATGAAGTNGTNGTNGATGATGATGAAGTNGTNGATGATGPTGAAGTNGTNGTNGAAGATGATGPMGPAGAANISGTTNYVIKFTGATTGGNSQLFDDGTNVGIGTTGPGVKLDVYGGSIRAVDLNNASLNATSISANSSAYFSLLAQAATPKEWRLINDGGAGGILKFYDASLGAERMVINTNGDVGIGTSFPGAKLQVLQTFAAPSAGDFQINNATATGNAIYAQSNGMSGNVIYAYSTGGARAGFFQLNSTTSTAHALQSEQYALGRAGHFEIVNNGNGNDAVFAGTNGSGASIRGYNNGSGRAGEFEITGAANNSAAIYSTHAGSGEGIAVFNNGTGKAGYFQIGVAGNGSQVVEAITYGTGKAGLFSISNNTSNANALESNTNGTGWAAAFFGSALVRGKGTTSATTALRVENTSATTLFKVFDNGNASIGTPNALNYGGFNAIGPLTNKRGLTIASGTSYTADAPAVLELIGSATNVGEEVTMVEFIHSSSNGSTYNIGRIAMLRENTNPTMNGMVFYNRQFANLNECMRISNTGNVGIGCNAPAYKLHVVGDIAAQGGIIRASSVSVSTTITACSDIRYKKDIRSLGPVLPDLLNIEGVRYKFKSEEFPERFFPETEQIGFIAQEVEKLFPELVITEKDGYKAIDYTRFAPLLLEALREQQKLIDAQKAQIEGMKAESSTSRQEIRSLKKENEMMRADIEAIKSVMNIGVSAKKD